MKPLCITQVRAKLTSVPTLTGIEIYTISGIRIGTTFAYYEAHTYQSRSTRLWYEGFVLRGPTRKPKAMRNSAFRARTIVQLPRIQHLHNVYKRLSASDAETAATLLNVATLTPTASRQPK